METETNMRKLFQIIILSIITFNKAFSVCSSPISRTNINAGQIPTSTKINADFNVLYDRSNELPGDCIQDSSIQTDSFESGAVTTAKIADATIEASKIASGLIPTYYKLSGIKVYTSSATWFKPSDLKFVVVQAVGGGGASGSSFAANLWTDAGASNFGGYCIAYGGASAKSGASGAAGGSAVGDIALQGGSGGNTSSNGSHFFIGKGGVSMFANYGRGGESIYYSSPNISGGGGGAGGYCMALIQAASLTSSVSVTVGNGGTWNYSTAFKVDGKPGIVIVHEYK